MKVAHVYRVETVEPCNAPRGVARGDWCRYVVTGGSAQIVGRHLGSLSEARKEAERFVSGLNSRKRNGVSPWAPPRGRKSRKVARQEPAARTS